MWQRVQTLYFALSVILLSFLVFGKIGTDFSGDEAVSVSYVSYFPYAVLLIGAYALNLISVFCFSHRSVQLRMTAVASVFLLALQVWLVVDYFTSAETFVFKANAIFPLIALILNILAIRGIVSDELLVRSSSRLRAAKRTTK